jgi:rifampicin phosphotransferase
MFTIAQSDNSSGALVAPLGRFTRLDLVLAGGKGANLGELTNAGFDVPPGFVITTAAYDLVLQNNALQKTLRAGLALLKPDEPASVDQVSRQIGDALKDASIPPSIADQILTAYRQLGGGAVAVRSSATAEDLPEAAFAGQQESFLNVLGEGPLLDAVRGCWASLWSERAILYRARQNLDQSTVKLAVVVQKMVPADAAGVMFTANPVSGDRDELVVDASPGLGEAVVAGMVTPDHYIVDKRSKRIKDQRKGRGEVVVRARAEGGTEKAQSGQDQTNGLALPPAAIHKLTQLGVAIERHYDAPQDIEWAWIKNDTKAGRILVVQARPVTALPEPIKISSAMRRLVPILAEMWPARPYPLDVTSFTGTVERAIGNLLVELIGKSAPDPGKVLVEEDGVVVRFDPPEVHPSPSILIAPWLALWRTRHYDPSRWGSDPLLAEVIAQARDLDQRDLSGLPWADVIDTLHEELALVERAMQVRERYFPRSLLALAILWLLLSLTRHGDRFGVLVSGVETKTAETNRALERLALEIRSDPGLVELFAGDEALELESALKESVAGRRFLYDLYAFLTQYGHREIALTISEGTWKDRPEVVLGILKALASAEPRESDNQVAWKKARYELLAKSILGKWPFRDVFLKSLTNGRALFQMREDTHFYATLAQPPVRRAALELGRRLAQVQALDAIDDVFHLRLEELEALGKFWPPSDPLHADIRSLVARRKAKRESLVNKPMIDPRLLAAQPSDETNQGVLLSGSPASPGIVSGPARIVRDGTEFGKLQAGDVLVAPVTNPAWTPLFQRAAAVVVDTGGSASHAAIVAREYGIPAVMGTVNGTQQLTDGQRVRVDGSRGLVFKGEDTK